MREIELSSRRKTFLVRYEPGYAHDQGNEETGENAQIHEILDKKTMQPIPPGAERDRTVVAAKQAILDEYSGIPDGG